MWKEKNISLKKKGSVFYNWGKCDDATQIQLCLLLIFFWFIQIENGRW